MKLHPDVTHQTTINRFKTLEADLYAIWGDKLDFTDSVFNKINTKLWYWCNTHKEKYEATPDKLMRGQGCPDCGRGLSNRAAKAKSKKAAREFPQRAEVIHPNKNYYHLVDYKGTHDKVELWCVGCDVSYWINPNCILKGRGHSKCGHGTGGKNKSKNAGFAFPAKAELKHPRKNYYHLVDYVNSLTKVELWCIGCNCSYWINPVDVLNGIGHSSCAKYGFKPNLPATLYYLRVETRNQIAYKIGITNLTVKERFSKADLETITIISEEHFELGQYAYDKEQSILKQFNEFQYKGDPILKSGNTELFYKDVLELDK